MTLSAIREARRIADGSEIPALGGWNRIGLVSITGMEDRDLLLLGATRGKDGWTVPRDRSLDPSRLESVLPRIAKPSIVPRMVDLIPSSSWHASLANLLVPSSWRNVRETTQLRAGSCEDCGSQWRLECHERWHYDDVARIQRLDGFEALCGPCHQTRHLGFASVRGTYAEACLRLAAVERLSPYEVKPYCDEVFRRFEVRSRVAWALDLTMLSGSGLRIKRDVSLDERGMLVGRVGSRSVLIDVLGARVEAVGRTLTLT